MRTIGLIANFNIKEKAEAAYLVAQRLSTYDCRILISEQYKDKLFRAHKHQSGFEYMSYDEIYDNAELAVVLGGDGFILDSARRAAPRGIPILGINLGRVGYMTELEIDEIELLDKVFDGEYRLDERTMLHVEIVSEKGQKRFSAQALNDAVVANGTTARIIDVELSEGDKLVNTYRADGLVIATPTGSTAYSLSAGGPIVDPKLACFCVTPICPHSLLSRPLVFPDSEELRVKNICSREKVLHLTVDGRATFDLFYGDSVVVTKSDVVAKLLRLKDEDFYSKIRMKKFL